MITAMKLTGGQHGNKNIISKLKIKININIRFVSYKKMMT